MRLMVSLILASVCFFASVANAAEMRTWTSGSKTVEAAFVSISDGVVLLENKDTGKRYRIRVVKLSQDDQDYVAQQLLDKDTGKGGFEDVDPPRRRRPNRNRRDRDEESNDQGREDDQGSDRERGSDRSGSGDRDRFEDSDDEDDDERIVRDTSLPLRAGQKGLVMPSEPSKWLNSPPITNQSIGNKAIVFVFFDEDNRYTIPNKWPIWLKTAKKFKGKPILFIAVNSGNPRPVVQQSLQKYKITWPTIVDDDRSFEHHCNIRPLSRSQPWAVRNIDGDGVFYYGANQLEAAAGSAMRGAKWRANPKGLPSSLKKAWNQVEYGRFKEAAPAVTKALKSRKKDQQRAAKRLNEVIVEHINDQIKKAERHESRDRKFAALLIYDKLLEDFNKYPLDKKVKKASDKLSKDPDLKVEIEAMEAFNAAKKLAGGARNARRRAISKLEDILDNYPDTVAAEKAEVLLEKLES